MSLMITGITVPQTQLAEVQAHPQFQARSDELLATLRQPSIAPAFALKDNIAWLSEAFTDKKRARSAERA